MPLLKRTPFKLLEPPNGVEPQELVFQVRFTKEIFRDYQEYLKRINLYRQRVWTCKVTAKTNLTFEEALVSEQQATEKVQQFPEELIGPVLRIVQYSMLPLRELVNSIRETLLDQLVEGVELSGRKDGCVHPCKIIKVLDEQQGKPRYEVAWLDEDHKIDGTAILGAEDLIKKKLPFTGSVLKSFIRESTYHNVPWVIHSNLAFKYGISTDPPEGLKSKISFLNGCVVSNTKRKKNEEPEKEKHRKRSRVAGEKSEDVADKECNEMKKELIKYPIDDLLVQPSADDPVFTDRPSPSRDFSVPMDCVGDLLMVWDFCSSFGRLLHLSPFSLEHFDKAICHKDSNLTLIMEIHAALLLVLIKDEGDYYAAIQKKKRKSKITLITWIEYLCDFLEMINVPELSECIATIKRGHYGLLDAHIKLSILCELVNQVLATNLIKVKLEEYINQQRALAASKRGEALEDGRKKREAKERLKAESEANGVLPNCTSDSVGNNSHETTKVGHNLDNGNVAVDISSQQNHSLENGDSKQEGSELRKMTKKLMEEMEKNKEERKEYLQREFEKRIIRTNPLGKDRDYNRYWFFRRDGRVFVESSDFKQWGYYSSKGELDALMGSLNPKGERERALKRQLEKSYERICSELQKRTKDTDRKIAMEDTVVRRSSRVRAPPRDNPALAFVKYSNKWKDDQSP
ncbi:hypothetical protein Ancab_001026 [Ancistrocladus abbreviatus]